MSVTLRFDDRLWNPYAVENIESSHPSLHAALKTWFDAISSFDYTSLAKLVNAQDPEEFAAAKEKGKASLAECPGVAATLESVIHELEAALFAIQNDNLKKQLTGLLESATINRKVLLEDAPTAVVAAKKRADVYNEVKLKVMEVLEKSAAQLDDMVERSRDRTKLFAELKPTIDQLKQLWDTVENALSPINRKEQAKVREPFDTRIRKAAKTLCSNLFTTISRDRKSGAWPMPVIAEQIDGEMANTAATKFASALPAIEK